MTTREIFNQVYMAANRSDAHSKWLTDAADVCDQDIMVCLDGSGKPVASLMALPYQFAYQDAMLDAVAIKYLSTRPEARARGAASHLIVDTLAAARSRGRPSAYLFRPGGICSFISTGFPLPRFSTPTNSGIPPRMFSTAAAATSSSLRHRCLHPLKEIRLRHRAQRRRFCPHPRRTVDHSEQPYTRRYRRCGRRNPRCHYIRRQCSCASAPRRHRASWR